MFEQKKREIDLRFHRDVLGEAYVHRPFPAL